MLVLCFSCSFMETCSNATIRQGTAYNPLILIKDLCICSLWEMSLDSLVSSINLMHISPNTNNQKLQEKRFREKKVVQTKMFRNSIQRKLEMHNKLGFFSELCVVIILMTKDLIQLVHHLIWWHRSCIIKSCAVWLTSTDCIGRTFPPLSSTNVGEIGRRPLTMVCLQSGLLINPAWLLVIHGTNLRGPME